MMIITIAPFPSVEYIYDVDFLEPNCAINSKEVSLNILSKGIHSAQIIKLLQDEPILLSMLGGFAGKYIKHYLDKSRIKTDIIWTDTETPHKMRILLGDTNTYYLLKRDETYPFDKEIIKLSQKLKAHIKKVSTLLLSGYIPPGTTPTLFREWIKEAKLHNIKTIVCTGQKDVLIHALEETPYALMFTEEQLNQLEIATDSKEAIIKALIPYLKQGVHYIAVYLKEQGALMLSKNKFCLIEPPMSLNKIISNSASSGAFLGTFALGINRKYEQEKFSKMCLAAALAANCDVNKPICSRKDIELLSKKVKIKEISTSLF
ncbi:PfkB family carbohydrate kinase [Cellulosilyticum sp. I15G10I2]|uniref:PfkB family carbohydrate kinase n=1 Tax=Cellulosilyticum sp. I15G10I2 TaxID=1892843 RepID=UPI00085BEF66|nr:PfkB family carbohydrate kinase [Cellulosilyticum sp. I15G10I2]